MNDFDDHVARIARLRAIQFFVPRIAFLFTVTMIIWWSVMP